MKPSVDVYGWRPEAGTVDDNGELIDDRVYEKQDFDRDLVIKERTDVVAKKITQFLKETDRYSKTIVFCVDIDHAERMRQALVNENSDIVKEHPTYIMRITGDSKEGKSKLDEFIDPDEKYPTIVTTSKLLTTGVNCKSCKLVVLDNVYGEAGHDRVQTDRRPRHAHMRTVWKAVLHHPGLPRRLPNVCRPRVRRRTGSDLRAGP